MTNAEITNALLFAVCDAACRLQDEADAEKKVIAAIRRDPLWPAFCQLVQDDVILAGPSLTANLVSLANREPTEGLTENALWNLFHHEF